MKKLTKVLFIPLLIFQIVHCTLNIDNCEAQWVMQSVPQNYGMVLSIDFVNSGNGVACGWYNGYGKALYTSNGGITWLPSIVPDSSRSFTAVTFIDSLTGFMAGAYNLFPASRSYSSLNRIQGNGYCRSMIEHMGNIGLSRDFDYKGLFVKTTDGGRRWFTHGILPSRISYLTGIDFIDASTGVITTSIQDTSVSMNATILKTSDGGLSWSEVLNIDSVWEFRSVKFIDNGNIIALGWGGSSDSNSSNAGGMIFKSTDQGSNWSLQFFRYNYFTDVSFTDDSTIFISANKWGDGLVYKSTNQGFNWNLIFTQSGNVSLEGIEFFKGSGTGMIFGTYYDLITYAFARRTTDYGASWGQLQLLDTTGYNLLYGGIMISSYNQYITGGNPFGQAAIYHTTNGGIAGVNLLGNLIPVMYTLSQNYPNPFNPVTNLEFGISDLGFVSLKIYDLLGKEVTTLVNEKLSPGTYKYEFDGSGLPSGVYFYRLTAGEFMETKRMMLVK